MICHPADTDWSFLKTEDFDSLDDDLKKRAEEFAWLTLAALTAYRIGTCPVTVRPVAASCAPAGTWIAAPVGSSGWSALPTRAIGSFVPHVVGGLWVNACGCASAAGCGHHAGDTVFLPGPVGSIESVKVAGATIDSSRYRVDSNALLVATDPALSWPLDCETSFEVSYYQGAAPNTAILLAAGLLASEWYKAMDGRKCKLPRGATQVARRDGSVISIETNWFENGRTGIDPVDAVIRAYNPYGAKMPPRVLSPDMPQSRRTSWGRW